MEKFWKWFTKHGIIGRVVVCKQDNKSIEDYFKRNKNDRSLFDELYGGATLWWIKNIAIEVKYAIDQRGGGLCADISVISLEEEITLLIWLGYMSFIILMK